MQFNSLYSFFMMGGYAGFVWPAYGITLFILCLQLIAALKDRREVIKSITTLEKTNASTT